ncbi:MAG: hypothetical protein B7733_19355 [Myxococcales bacterium FL481]|nr:MAG: hypothetical protein B7733_19355 [Myxococcales bacterium FL481]
MCNPVRSDRRFVHSLLIELSVLASLGCTDCGAENRCGTDEEPLTHETDTGSSSAGETEDVDRER